MVPSTSTAAYRSLPKELLEDRVLKVVHSFGSFGCTYEDVKAAMPTLSHSSVTARFKPLEDKGLIFRAGDTRPGTTGRAQKVIRAMEFASTVVPAVMAPLLTPKKKKQNPFLAGVIFATRIVLKQSDLPEARRALHKELLKLAAR